MNWLAFIFALEAGIVPQNSFVMYQRQAEVFLFEGHYYYPVEVTRENIAPILYTDLRAGVELWDFLFAEGSIRVQMTPNGITNFDPQSLFYDFRAGARYKGLELFWHHACRHPQMTYAYRYQSISGWEGAYSEIGVRVEVKVKPWRKK